MNTKFATALVLASTLMAGTSFAAGNNAASAYQEADRHVSIGSGMLTRDAVKADYQAAKKAGALPQSIGQDYKLAPMTTSLTREAVMDAVPAQKKAGQTIQINNYS